MGAIWLNNIKPGCVHMVCMQPLLVVRVMTFCLRNLRLFFVTFILSVYNILLVLTFITLTCF